MGAWLVGWDIRRFNIAAVAFAWGGVFRVEFGDNSWIVAIIAALLLGLTLRRG